ncbi:2056_t:CDS:2, partial [Entrophospora sp. SA101]
ESVIEGLSCLFSRLYGISFEASEILPGEAWCEDIYKFDVIDEKEGKVGTIYCDLFNRFGKLQTAAHYTVRCSRRVDDDDALGDLPSGYDPAELDDLATSDPGAIVNGRPGRYQLPIVVLTCDFAKSKDQNVPTLLNLIEVETLFHEMGTRCPTDFVELPSILMEHFVYSPSVLSLFAKHYETKEPLPLELIQHYSKERLQFTAIETQSQIVMSLLDQLYHSSIVSRESSPNFDTTSILANLQDTVGLFPSVPGTAWQTQFFHLFGYGAGYYSYLFCRTLAGKIWKDLFEKDPLSREAGERFKEELLKWGGSKDPWICIGRTLRDERIMNGDSKSVAIVGEWVYWISSRATISKTAPHSLPASLKTDQSFTGSFEVHDQIRFCLFGLDGGVVTFIALNVGGVFFNTTKKTLLKHGDGYFSSLFNNAMERVYNERNNIFIDRNGKLFEYLRNDKLLKRIHDDKELLEDLLTEAEFFGINKLVNDIKSLIDPGIEKIHYHVVTTGIESLTYYRCPHGHDPERIGEGRYSSSNCRHTSVELVEDNVYFILSNN